MTILVLGASGGIGSWFVQEFHNKGYRVEAVIRPSTAYEPPSGVRIINGEVTDSTFVSSIIKDEQIIVCCVGIRRKGKNPWSTIESPSNLVETVLSNVVEAAKSKQKVRVLWISAAGVGASKKQCSWLIKNLIKAGNIGVAYTDLEKASKIMEASTIPSIAVLPVTLRSGKPVKPAEEIPRYTLFSTVRRSEIALWMVQAVENIKHFDGRSVLVG